MQKCLFHVINVNKKTSSNTLLMLFYSHIRSMYFLICLIALSFSSVVFAEQAPLTSPLNLTTALSFAKDHPRTKLSINQKLNLQTPQQSFLLNCHKLAFTNTTDFDSQRNSVATNFIHPIEQQKLFILQSYFDVLLADASIGSINEDMAGAFIEYDRAKIRQEFKQYSEIRVARLEAIYQDVLQQRFSGEALQRLTRFQLAKSINHPDDLSSDLNPPTLIKPIKNLPDSEETYKSSLKNNDWIKSLENENNPEQMAIIKMNLRQQILELTSRLQVLNSAIKRAETESYSRDLNLELSRSLYDMEVKASLGRSMTLQSKARIQEDRIGFCITLTWAQLNALQGRNILTQPVATKEEATE